MFKELIDYICSNINNLEPIYIDEHVVEPMNWDTIQETLEEVYLDGGISDKEVKKFINTNARLVYFYANDMYGIRHKKRKI